jgi:LCP family protein required for cell wall assembly
MSDNELNNDINISDDDILVDITDSLAKQINQELETDNKSEENIPEETPPEKPEKKRRMPKWAKRLTIIFSVIMVLAIGGMAILSHYLDRINYTDWSNTEYFEEEFDQDDISGLTEVNPDDIILNSSNIQRTDKDVVNILLVGEEAINDGKSRGRTDSMMIATINTKEGALKLTSLMRDMYVEIPGYSDNKLNAAYHNGGMPLLKETIETNFDIDLDGSVLVNFDGFQDIIDKLGGVEITLSEAEASYLNRTNYISDPSNRNVVAGTQILNGNQALGYARVRYVKKSDTEHDDFGRTSRHRTLLTAIFDKYKSKSLPELVTLLYDILPLVTTDIDKSTIMSYLSTVATMGVTELQTLRLPVDGAYSNSNVRGMSVLLPDPLQENIDALHEFVFGKSETDVMTENGQSTTDTTTSTTTDTSSSTTQDSNNQ